MNRFSCAMLSLVSLAGLTSVLEQISFAEELSPAVQQIREDVKLLASDEFEGRGIGTQGIEKAAEYIVDEFRKAGLSVTAAGGDAYQDFEVNDGVKLGETNVLTLKGPNGQVLNLEYDKDFRTCAFGSTGTFDAPVAFLGYGIDSQEAEYNDFDGIDVKGKVVVVMRRNPQQNNPQGKFAVGHGISRFAALTTKVGQAFSKGAVAVLVVNDTISGVTAQKELEEKYAEALKKLGTLSQQQPENAETTVTLLKETQAAAQHLIQLQDLIKKNDLDPLMPFGYGGTRQGQSVPVFQISIETCNKLLTSDSGLSLAEIEAKIDETGKPLSKELSGWSASGEATVLQIKVPVKNVIGVLEGEGPLKEETIVIGAHFDHIGQGGEGSFTPEIRETHNGADDNASGVAGLLEMARRLGKLNKPLPRRVVFIAFTAEERGLLGSDRYVKEPLFPIENTIAMFNMDMIGRMEDSKLVVFGTGTSTRWEALVDTGATQHQLLVSKKPEGFGPSDHASFYGKKIPVLHLFTGTHSDYHRPSDDWEKINFQDIDRIVTFLEEIVLDTAFSTDRPDYVEVKGNAQLERTGNRPYFGSIPDFGKDVSGYAIQGVSADSPAAKGGILGGDVIIKLGDDRIGGLDDFDLVLRKFKPGEQVAVTVLREGQEVVLNVTLATSKG
ncbi:M20/M25/M40 family metallo-hydrolase [Planctomicrobium sp. SH668]|uniref:M20/M25/M40 family metallo-hydrolase n=1 Tax=Planctomicrobium sp. SH668 TaxID=3448126 RepID=UPI003F5B5D6D